MTRNDDNLDSRVPSECVSHSELLLSKMADEKRSRIKGDSTIICRLGEIEDMIRALRSKVEANSKDIGSLYIMFSVAFTLLSCEFVVLMWIFFKMIG